MDFDEEELLFVLKEGKHIGSKRNVDFYLCFDFYFGIELLNGIYNLTEFFNWKEMNEFYKD